MHNQLYKLWYQISSYKMSVTECTLFFMWWLVLYEEIWCDNIYSWFCRIHCCVYSYARCIMQNQLYKLWYRIPSYKMSVTEYTSVFMWWLVLYEGIWCDNIYNWFCRIHVLPSLHSFDLSTKVANLYPNVM